MQSREVTLNAKQQQAVDHIDGPLLVVAGPGTGKTQLLSARVASILAKTDTSAQNILCLTFTNKAAANMRLRLQKTIGPDALHVNVKTFHSFAAEVMGEYPDHFWNGADLVVAPDAVQTEIINTILTRLPLDNPLALKFAGRFTSTKRVQDGLKLVKEAGLTPEKLRALIHANIAYLDAVEPELVRIFEPVLSYKKLPDIARQIQQLPEQPIDEMVAPLVSLSTLIKDEINAAVAADADTNKTAHTGEVKKKYVQNEAKIKGMHRQRRANAWWLALADVYELYRDELHRRGHYDYADMLVEVIAQIDQRPELLSELQERYHYVLIDEFQDSNAAQMRLAHAVSSHPVLEGKPNLMVVGDDDQSIYKFNGAELSNMLGFRRMYPASQTIVLTDNYRSSSNVLHASRQIIELASDRLVIRDTSISKDLVAKNEPAEPGSIEHRLHQSAEDQLFGAATDIQQAFNGSDQTIAVLARSHASLETMAAQLQALGVPVRYERQQNILQNTAVMQIVSICKIIQGIIDGNSGAVNQHIASVLGHPVWGLDARTLWQLAVDNRYNPDWLASLLDHQDETFQAFGTWLMWLAAQAQANHLAVVLDYILGLRPSDSYHSPFRAYYIDTPDQLSSDYTTTLSAIQRLRGLVAEYAGTATPTVADFVRLITLHEENRIGISDASIFVTAERAVELLTVHKAKGLEFDQIYLLDCTEKQWRPSVSRFASPANLPLQPYGDDMDDYVRLMYVAATRAKSTFVAYSYKYSQTGEDIVPSPLIAHLPVREIARTDHPDTVAVLESALTWPRLTVTEEKRLFTSLLEDYSLNVTALQNFIDVTGGGPTKFLHNNLLRLPGARTITLAYGTAIHTALERAQRLINNGDFSIEQVQTAFETALGREPILPDELSRWTAKGRGLLETLFEEQRLLLPEDGTPEQKLQGIDIDGAIIDGTLDHIITDGDDILISDYKTGSGITSFASQARDAQVKIHKHKMQLVFYAMLAQNHPLYAGKNITAQMLYIEADQAKDIARSFQPAAEDIDRLAALTRAVYHKIINYDLPDISGYSTDIEGILQFEQDLIDGKV